MTKHGKLLLMFMVFTMFLTLFAGSALAVDAGNSVDVYLSVSPNVAYNDGTVSYTVTAFNASFIDGANAAWIDVSFTPPGPDGSASGTTIVLANGRYIAVGETITWNKTSNPELEINLSFLNPGVEVAIASADYYALYDATPSYDASGTKNIPVTIIYEELTVAKTVETYFERTHEWDIDKEVTTEFGHFLEGVPKIWLVPDASGDECATWYVDVYYQGFTDHDYNVSGTVTIENTGTAAAVITGVEDLLGGTPVNVDFGVAFPYNLPVGDILVGTYSENDEFTGQNQVTVMTERDSYMASEDIIWGAPDVELLETVNIEDDSSEYGVNHLGSVTAPNGNQFTYSHCFAWADFDAPGPYVIENTATIVETGQDAEAILKINWLDEELLVTKTAVTSYERTHIWDIEKDVTTEFGHTVDDGIAKIWLWRDGSGDETATWNVCVTYMGYEDSELNVSGVITITNTGTADAVIIDVFDELCAEAITVDFPVTFPYILGPGEILEGTYDEALMEMLIDCLNEVTVITEVDQYSAQALVEWGEPDEEYLDVVNIEDVSDLFGTVHLGTLDAADLDEGDVNCFDYDQFFEYGDFSDPGPHIFDNTATIIETGQNASARLKINWEPPDENCFYDETAWAYGGPYANPNWDYVNNRFWGWTNGPLSEGSYEFDIYAGAGLNDISKGTLVGVLYVDFYGDCVTVKYEMGEVPEFGQVYLGEVHLWVGLDVLPGVTRGKTTVYTNAPGQFPEGDYFMFDPDNPMAGETEWEITLCGFDGEEIYVAAHAVVWIPYECPEQ